MGASSSSSVHFQEFVQHWHKIQHNEGRSRSTFKIDFTTKVENAKVPLPICSPPFLSSSSSSSSSGVILRTLRHNPHDAGQESLPPPTTSYANDTTLEGWIPSYRIKARDVHLLNSTVPSSNQCLPSTTHSPPSTSFTSASPLSTTETNPQGEEVMSFSSSTSSSSTSTSSFNSYGQKEEVIGHSGLGHYVYLCWAKEQGCVLRPDMFWFTICAEFAREVRLRPELYRCLFTSSQEGEPKDTLIILTEDETDLPLENLDRLLQEKIVCKELHDLIVKNPFGSTVPVPNQENYSQTMAILFSNASTPFYDIQTTFCGIPFVKIEGAEADWKNLGMSIHALENILRPLNKSFGDYLSICRRTVDDGITPNAFYSGEIRGEVEGEEKRRKENKGKKHKAESYFSGIFWITKKCGSGHPYLCRGWILDFYYRSTSGERHFSEKWRKHGDPANWKIQMLTDLPTHAVFVPWRYKQGDTNRMFVKTAGLFYSIISVPSSACPSSSSDSSASPVSPAASSADLKSGREETRFLHPYYGTNTYEITSEALFTRLAMTTPPVPHH